METQIEKSSVEIKAPIRIRTLKQSIRALKLGLWSLIPVAGYPMAIENFRIFKSLLKEKNEGHNTLLTAWICLGFAVCQTSAVSVSGRFPDPGLTALMFLYIGFLFLNEVFVLNRMAWNPCRLRCFLGFYLSTCSVMFGVIALSVLIGTSIVNIVNK